MQVEIRSKVPGAANSVLPVVTVELGGETTTVRELIRRAVIEQINVTKVNAASARAMLDRQYLTPDEVRVMSASGEVRIPTVDVEPDDETEVARAIRAYTRGAFAVFCGGRQLESLDDAVTVRAGEPVVFVRLAPLVGG